MRMAVSVIVMMLGLASAAVAQHAGNGSTSAANGNRANGLNYQPTPNEVSPREKAAGVQPPTGQQNTNDRDLENIDRNVLRSEGQSTRSVPAITPHQ